MTSRLTSFDGSNPNLQRLSHLDQHIYVIQFESGRIKVGVTKNFERRLQQHSALARAFDEAVARYWVSDMHTQASENELALIEFCAKRGRQCSVEWFMDVSFTEVVEYAKRLPMYLDEVVARESKARAGAMMRALTVVETENGQESWYDMLYLESAMKIAAECFEMVRDSEASGPMFEPLEDMGGISLFQGFAAFHLWDKEDAERRKFRARVDAATLEPFDRMTKSLAAIFEEIRQSVIDLGQARPDLLTSSKHLSQERVDWVNSNFRAA